MVHILSGKPRACKINLIAPLVNTVLLISTAEPLQDSLQTGVITWQENNFDFPKNVPGNSSKIWNAKNSQIIN